MQVIGLCFIADLNCPIGLQTTTICIVYTLYNICVAIRDCKELTWCLRTEEWSGECWSSPSPYHLRPGSLPAWILPFPARSLVRRPQLHPHWPVTVTDPPPPVKCVWSATGANRFLTVQVVIITTYQLCQRVLSIKIDIRHIMFLRLIRHDKSTKPKKGLGESFYSLDVFFAPSYRLLTAPATEREREVDRSLDSHVHIGYRGRGIGKLFSGRKLFLHLR